MSAENSESQKLPSFKFKAHKSCLYSLENANEYLVSGGLNEIAAWKWDELLNKVYLVIRMISGIDKISYLNLKHTQPSWSIKLPTEYV